MVGICVELDRAEIVEDQDCTDEWVEGKPSPELHDMAVHRNCKRKSLVCVLIWVDFPSADIHIKIKPLFLITKKAIASSLRSLEDQKIISR